MSNVRSRELQRFLPWVLLYAAGLAIAAPPINDVCPGADAVLSSVSFPLDVAASVSQGTVEVDFTVRTDGSVADVVVHSSTDPVFEASALQAISKFTCA